VSYVSEAAEVKLANFLTARENDTLTLDFALLEFDGIITVEVTDARVISSNIVWTTIEVFSVNISTTAVTKTYIYPVFNRELTWVRVKYENTTGNTGKIKKVLVNV
jgi:hypothetical protein